MCRLTRFCAALSSVCLLAAGLSGCRNKVEPVTTLTIWHYYNSTQQETFNRLVDEFNSTVGAERRITVLAYNQGSINDVAAKTLSALENPAAAERAPDLFAAYADVASEADELGKLADLTPCFTPEELSAYQPEYLDEGTFGGRLKLFPIAKCSELLYLNETEWSAFAAATGASRDELSTWEGLAQVSERYYQWTDSLTPDAAGDGRAFFGRDAFANYMLVGSAELGAPIFDAGRGDGKEIQLDEAVLHRLWDNYFIPYVSGCYTEYGRFRSDDLRTGCLACYVGSSSGANHFPKGYPGGRHRHPHQGLGGQSAQPLMGAEPMAVQQGAGLAVAASDEKREQAAAAFLKWFTEPERNAQFAVSTAYSPVTIEANTPEALNGAAASAAEPVEGLVLDSLLLSSKLPETHRMYAPAPFPRQLSVRTVVNEHLPNTAKAGRVEVLRLMEAGLSRAGAVAEVASEAAFQSWAASFQAALNAARA